MLEFCRLCAEAKTAQELTSTISEQLEKLVNFCQWNASEQENSLPQNICMTCIIKLEDFCRFLETIKSSEAILRKSALEVDEQRNSHLKNVEYIHVKMDPNVEDIESGNSDNVDFYLKGDGDYVTNQTEDLKEETLSIVGPSNDNLDDFETDLDPITKNKEIKKVPQPRKRYYIKKGDREFEIDSNGMLTKDDCNADGSIKDESIDKLKQQYPFIKTHSRLKFDFECPKCKKLFNDYYEYQSHINLSHAEERDSIVHQCFYCKEFNYKLSALHKHIQIKHMAHLMYR